MPRSRLLLGALTALTALTALLALPTAARAGVSPLSPTQEPAASTSPLIEIEAHPSWTQPLMVRGPLPAEGFGQLRLLGLMTYDHVSLGVVLPLLVYAGPGGIAGGYGLGGAIRVQTRGRVRPFAAADAAVFGAVPLAATLGATTGLEAGVRLDLGSRFSLLLAGRAQFDAFYGAIAFQPTTERATGRLKLRAATLTSVGAAIGLIVRLPRAGS